ncbi:nicotinate-nucleotide--dimethylbenzimidazole phosphoribosyltransferase [Streptomyces sp. NPDC021056]|uniref:nicotinate-nucleotide--dimethylbenzimidazole phosphoribosyltransferase n=1 Tax=Streptomyces sp. NPDC021056 TaxID=3155012 RepID=UPI0033C2994E
MTDTGQVPGEGLPENAGMVEQPGVPAHGAYTYLSETTAEDEDLLLLPGAQGAWGNEVAPPAPEPVVETVHAPGPHEMSGRDSGAHDLSAVRVSDPVAAPSLPIPPITPRRPLHLGPPIPDASASPVRSLADRGPAGAPVRQSGPPTAGPEYLDVPQPLREMSPQGAAPWGAPAPMGTMTPAAETVVPVPDQGTEPAGAANGVPRPQEDAYAEQDMAGADGAPAAGEAYGEPLVAEHAPEAGGVPGSEGLPVAGVPAADGFPGAEGVPGDSYAPGAETVQGDVNVPGPVAFPETAAANAPEANGIPVAAHTPDGTVPEAGEGPAVVSVPEGGEVPAAGQIDGPEFAGEAGQDVGVAPAPETVPVPDAVDAADAAQGAVAEGLAGAVEVPASAEVPDAAPVPDAVEVADFAQVPAPAVVPDADQPATAVPLPDLAQAPEAPLAPEPAEPQPVPEPEAPGPEFAQVAEPTDAVAEVAEPAGLQAVPLPDAPGPEADQTAVPVPDVAEAAVPEPVPAPEDVPAPEATVPAPVPEPAEAVVPPAPGFPAPEPPAPVPSSESTDAEQLPHPVDPEAVAQPEPLAAAAEQFAQPEGTPTPAPADVTQEQTEQPAPVDAVAPFADAPAPAPVPEAPHPVAAPAEAPAEDPQAVPAPVAQVDPAFAPSLVAEPAGPQVLFVDQDQPVAEAPQPVGQFVPVEGSVPTTPHLAPTPPQALVLPPEEHPAVPAPRDGDPELVQHADDLDTRGADQEESTAPVEEVRQSTGPAAPAYDDAEREAVLKVMRERRDIRNGFRSDPIPHEVLLRVLEAAHTAPSVGHSQPWDFVVIRSAETRRTMHELAMRQRDAYAKSLPKGRAKQFKELKIEAILDTPVNIVVTADPTRGGRHTLGRHTQPQMAPYSSALAVENLWLAARAEGLGVGWVSFFDEREMVRSLGLPEHLEVVAYLCVGYVDEFPDEPELLQAGWSKRRPLSWVVHEETYGRRALPGEEPHDLLAETVSQIRPLDAKALGEAWERQKRMTKPPGSLGMLEIISAQLSGLSRQCPPPIPEPAAVAIFAGDHGVHAQGVTPWPQEVTAQMVANFLGGGAVCNAFAAQVGAEVCVVDVGVAADLPATPGLLPRKVRAGTSDMTTGPAMTREEARQAIEVGIETARDLVAAGNKALLTGEMGIANTTASAALISVFTDTDPAEVTGRGTGINDETLARKTEVVRRAIEVHQPDPADPIGVLAAIGGFEHAAMVGLLLGGASLRTPVILDGVSAGAAALVARAIAPEVLAACIAGHRSAEPGHVAALNKLGLRPLVDLDLRLGEGTGALLALPLVQSTARAMHEVATFDSAGVTEK